MTVGMKVSLVVLVLFGAVLAFYYGLGTSRATQNQIAVEPAPVALHPPKAAARSDARAADSPPRRLGDIARTTQGVLSESVQRATGRSPQPRQTTVSANSKQADADRLEPEVPANDPLVKYPNERGPSADSPARRTTPARTVPYTVKENDSLWTIADAWFGDAGRWDLIAKANPLIDPDRLKPGQVLRLPPKKADRRRSERRRVSPNEPNSYTIRSGDSLWRIAKAQYGDETKWSVIYDANRATIGPDPARLKVGRSLRIPPLSS